MGKTPAVLLAAVLLAAMAAGSGTALAQERSPIFGLGIHGNWYQTGSPSRKVR